MYDRVHLGYADTIIVPPGPSIFTIRSSAYRRPTPEEYGRPAHIPTEKSRGEVETLAAFGIPQDDIARVLDIDPKTLRKHYVDQLELGSIKATVKVAQNLFTIACKPTREGLQAAIFWLRVRAGWSEYSPLRLATRTTGDEPLGKKAAAELASETAHEGTEWSDLVKH